MLWRFSIFYLRSAVRGRNARWRPLVSSIIANTLQTNGFTTFVTFVNITLFLAEPHEAWVRELGVVRAFVPKVASH